MKTTAMSAPRASRLSLPRIAISDGAIEAIKWFALICMTCDHVDKYLLHASVPALYDIGRLAMPLFGFVLAFNLARPGMLESGMYGRAMKRLAMVGILATPAFIGLGGLVAGFWPLNIMFMLLTVAATLYLIQRKGRTAKITALIVFVVGGSSVEFWWPAVGFCLAAWCYCKRPTWLTLSIGVACLTLLYVINGNSWALVALPLIVGASFLKVELPRLRYAFYAYYPLHLTALWAIHALSS